MLAAEDTWEQTNRGPYIKTYSGRKVYLADPRPSDFSVTDIARHLAGINRYSGGSRFTVAQHCVLAAEFAARYYQGSPLLPARMLIHDADEAFYGDVSSPLKSLLPDYKALEDKAQLAMERFFNLTFIGDPLVHEVDKRMYLTERAVLFSSRWGKSEYTGPLEPFPVDRHTYHHFEEWPAEEAEANWLTCCRQFFPGVE